MQVDDKILVLGAHGMVGRAIVRALEREGYTNLVAATRKHGDLANKQAVDKLFQTERPKYVFLAAAKVGGIQANSTKPAEFGYLNGMIELNCIHACYEYKVEKLLFLGSSCIYPKEAEQPIKESALLTGPLEKTNELYALAKILGLKLCEAYRSQYGCNFISCMPCNLYGSFDNFDLAGSHVLPAWIRKFHEGKQAKRSKITLWGTGKVFREFLHVDDLAKGCLLLMRKYSEPETINIGSGHDLLLAELAEVVKSVIGFEGAIEWDSTRPSGTYRKLLDVSKINQMGWAPTISLRLGIAQTYDWFLKQPV